MLLPSEKKPSRFVRIFNGAPEWLLPGGLLQCLTEDFNDFTHAVYDLRPNYGPHEWRRRLMEDWRIVHLSAEEHRWETELPLIERPASAGSNREQREIAVSHWIAKEALRNQWQTAGIRGVNQQAQDAEHRRAIVLDSRLDTATAYRLAARIGKAPEHLCRELRRIERYEARGWCTVFPPLPQVTPSEFEPV